MKKWAVLYVNKNQDVASSFTTHKHSQNNNLPDPLDGVHGQSQGVSDDDVVHGRDEEEVKPVPPGHGVVQHGARRSRAGKGRGRRPLRSPASYQTAPAAGRGSARLLRNLSQRESSVASQALSTTASPGRGILLRELSTDSTLGDSSITSHSSNSCPVAGDPR